MKVLALERENPGADMRAGTAEILREEAARVWELQQAGVIREVYFRADRSAAVLVLECPSAADAGSILATLPLVERGLIEFEVIPLAPYTGFARLFR